ncbi:hypothetical protein SCHPADRAFT_995901 [Schizopora paradoxa]|uniref:Uncharacterized protein n=1 Tax=Schizopora paradoxa TaxID=27342 RepID=A0A0H2RUA4_9AGAM|nr:hypothetical protein SCHPADRAFT_995901 [Schizopora paradoxa]
MSSRVLFNNAAAARRFAVKASRRPGCSWKRFQSSSSSQQTSSSGSLASHMVAGIAGGGVVILAGYAYYHQSGLKTVVQTSKEFKLYLQSTKDSVVEKTRQATKNPSQALESLKGIVKSYVAFVPGGSAYVDSAFEQIEDLRETHGDETNKAIQEITDEISKVVSEGKADVPTAAKVFEAMRKGMSKIQELGKKVGGDALEKNPKAKEMLSSGFGQLMNLAGKGDQEAKRAYEAINERLQAIEKFQEKFGHGDISESLGNGADAFKKAIESLPRGDEIIKKAPHLQDIVDLAQKRGDEAKDLLEETYRDVSKVLEEKGKKAKELGKKAASDANN